MWKRVEKTWKQIGDEIFILDGENEKTHTLNATATWLWHHLSDARTVDELSGLLVLDFDTTYDIARNDLEELLQELAKKGLVISE